MSKSRSTLKTKAALQKSSLLEKKLGVEQLWFDEQDDEDLQIDAKNWKPSIITIKTDPLDENFPPLTGVSDFNAAKSTHNEDSVKETKKNAPSLMDANKIPLDLTNPFIKKLEEDHPGIGAIL